MEDIRVQGCVRCFPKRTINFLKTVRGEGYAIISERTPNRPFQKCEDAGWIEIGDGTISLAAVLGYAIFYKTASFGGRHRVYRSINPVAGHYNESRN